MRISVLKPIIWNPSGYLGPSGRPASSGYPYKHGFGHDEWNGQPGRVWQGYRVFHAEEKKTSTLFNYSRDGNLGMLMFASHDGQQVAVGVAANVFENDREHDMPLIAADLGFHDRWQEVWAVPLVQKRYGGDLARFRRFWDKEYDWIQWKAPKHLYHWFEEPFLLNARALTGKGSLIPRFSSFQRLHPLQIAELIRPYLPSNKRSILHWFEQGPFDEEFLAGGQPSENASEDGGSVASAAAASKTYRYWIEGDRLVEPLHARLQAQYSAFLRKKGHQPVPNVGGVDIRYVDGEETVFVEVKPTHNVPPRFAVRCAVGQLLEYRFRSGEKVRLEIVLDSRPDEEQIGFLRHMGIRLRCRSKATFETLL